MLACRSVSFRGQAPAYPPVTERSEIRGYRQVLTAGQRHFYVRLPKEGGSCSAEQDA